MSRYVIDIETDGLLQELTQIHCIALYDLDTDAVQSFADQPGFTSIEDGLFVAAQASLLVAHNGTKFDFPAIEKIKPGWYESAKVWGNPTLRDTLLLSRVIWPNIAELDAERRLKKPEAMPGNLVGAHGLKAWGYRLGAHKGDYSGGWETWSPEMHAYMEQDTVVTAKLWRLIEAKQLPDACTQLEHRFAEIMFLQEQRGFGFDVPAANVLHAALVERRLQIESELQRAFPPWWAGDERTPVRSVNLKRPDLGTIQRAGKGGKPLKPQPIVESYTEGAPYSKLERVTFNPGSRHHIADRLKKLRGWRPQKFTADGRAQIDETILGALPYPEAATLNEYLMVEKRLGAIADGKNAWLRLVRGNRIHGEVNTNGAATARCTHSKPNISQVPSVHNADGVVPYGRECRALFVPAPGYVIVGADASGLQLRCLAHYMAKWDGGEYANIIVGGNAAEGTDVHSVNARAAGIDTRDRAKRFIYALIFGAGDPKLGSILEPTAKIQRQKQIGAETRTKLLANIPAFGSLVNGVRAACARGHLGAIDGRRIPIRSPHSALNYLLQSAEAIAIKSATVILYDALIARGWRWGREWAQVAHVHDEIQAEVKPDLAEEYGAAAVAAIEEAGRRLGFRCRLTGAFKIGNSWAETH